jgi:hypothetical protein
MRKILALLYLVCFAAVTSCYAGSAEQGELQAAPAVEQKPLIIYYSLAPQKPLLWSFPGHLPAKPRNWYREKTGRTSGRSRA